MVRGCGFSHGGSVSRGSARERNDTVTYQSEARAPARAYVVKTYGEGDAINVVAGIFLLYYELVFALIDSGSSHSYINSEVVKSRRLESETS